MLWFLLLLTSQVEFQPNLDGLTPTIISVQKGNWTDPNTWGGRVPAPSDNVMVLHDVSLDQTLASVQSLGVKGKLSFRRRALTWVRCREIFVYPQGYLDIGTPEDPITGWALVSFIDSPLDPKDVDQWGHGLLVAGKITACGAPKSPFARLTGEVLQGQSTFRLEAAPQGWIPNDDILIPDTRQLMARDRTGQMPTVAQNETSPLTGVFNDAVVLAQPTKYAHKGARDHTGSLVRSPHMVNLTRNVVFASENANGVRAHSVFTYHSQVMLAYAAFVDMGRTTTAKIDPVSNHIGRYPVHLHYQDGAAVYIIGCVVKNTVDSLTRWGFVVHHTSFATLTDNIVYNREGAAFVCEDGYEHQNLIKGNMACSIRGTGGRENWGNSGTAFDFRTVTNQVVNNVAYGCYSRDTVEAAYGFRWYVKYAGVTTQPDRGKVANLEPGGTKIDNNAVPMNKCESNEVWASDSGFTVWWVSAYDSTPQPVDKSYMTDCAAIHCFRYPFYWYHNHNYVLDRFMVLGDQAISKNQYEVCGSLFYSDYMTSEQVVQNCYFGGCRGFGASAFTRGNYMLDKCTLATTTGFGTATPWTVNGASMVTDRNMTLRDCTFVPITGRSTDISRTYIPTANGNMTTGVGTNLLVRDQLFVVDTKANKILKVFYKEQVDDPLFTMPAYGSNANKSRPIISVPDPGYTVAKAWATFGKTLAGEVAPPDAVSDPRIQGRIKQVAP